MATPTLAPKASETDIDRANQWMRSQPWYLAFIQSIGQDPSYVHLNEQQKKQFAQIAASNGLPLPSNDEIDPAGNINPKGHKLRNFLIAAAIGGAAVGGAAALGAFSGAGTAGAGGAAASGVGAAGASGTLAATTTVPLASTLTAGGVASGAVPAAVAGGSAAAAGGGAALSGAAATGGLGALGWASLAGGVGSNVLGAYLQSRASGKAADLEAQGNKEALDFTKKVYEQERADLAPYRALGAGSVSTLSQLMGLPAQPAQSQGANLSELMANGARPPNPATTVGVAVPRGSDPSTQLITMVAPDGTPKQVPANQYEHWSKLGARLAQGPMPSSTVPQRAPMGGVA